MKYRYLEFFPGILMWGTFVLMFVLSWLAPAPVAIFAILYDSYWLFKSVYMLFHLRESFKKMKAHLATDWIGEIEATGKKWEDIVHLVIFPMYKEPYAVAKESFDTLLASDYPKDKMIVVLALEGRAGEEAQETGRRIEKEYGHQFFRFVRTTHPADLPDEIPGKGSNEHYAAKIVKEEVIDPLGIPYERILASVFDIDTQVPRGYFSRLTYMFLTVENPLRCIYQPIPLFTNNVYEAPAFARVISFSCTFWNMMQQSRPHLLRSFSSQSISFKALADVGFWQKDVVAEDSRIFWQGLLHYDGDFRTEPMIYPVQMDVNVGESSWQTMKNLYKQQRRWAWGVEDVPHLMHEFPKNTRIKPSVKRYWLLHTIEDFYSWATSSVLIFFLGRLPVVLGGRAFNETMLSYNLPLITELIVTISMLGIMVSVVGATLLLPEPPAGFKKRQYAWHILQWLLVPFTLIVFGAFPAIEAQTRLMLGGKWRLGFWVTPKSRTKSKEGVGEQ